jgi:Amt family ammonium transporter
VTSLSAPQFSDSTTIICIFCLFLIPLTAVGLALLNTGLGRSRSAAHTMAASLCILAVGAVAYFVCGFAFQGFPGQASHVLRAGGKGWDWLAASPFFLRRLEWNGSPPSLTAAFGMLCAGLAGLISLGAAQERWRLGSICVSTALLAGWTFPLFAHWAWGGGWLAQLGRNYGLGQGFADVGGSGCIQVVGGLTALSVAWMVGPRRGKYSSRNLSNAIPAHNAVFVLFGGLLAWVGWLGLNSAGAMLFAKATPGQIVLVVINTTLAASSGGLAALAVTGVRFGRPDASLTANGWIGGLVASSAACVFFKPAEAVVVGAIAGILVTYSVEWLEFDLKLDDSGAAISAHAVGGIWGLIAAGLFASFPINLNAGSTASGSDSGQFLAQVVGIATLIGFILPMSYGLNWLLGRVVPQRARLDGEQQGMDLHELGTEAYPEFVVHSDEFSQR